jgi:hypothetical protein
VSFVGSVAVYDKRKIILSNLKEQGIDVYLAGPNPRKYDLTLPDIVKIYKRSKLSINITSNTPLMLPILGRPWEVLLSGSLLFENLGSSCEAYFEPWKHYIPYWNSLDLAEKIQYFTKNGEEAHNIARLGSRVARKFYSPQLFWAAIFDRIGIALAKTKITLPKVKSNLLIEQSFAPPHTTSAHSLYRLIPSELSVIIATPPGPTGWYVRILLCYFLSYLIRNNNQNVGFLPQAMNSENWHTCNFQLRGGTRVIFWTGDCPSNPKLAPTLDELRLQYARPPILHEKLGSAGDLKVLYIEDEIKRHAEFMSRLTQEQPWPVDLNKFGGEQEFRAAIAAQINTYKEAQILNRNIRIHPLEEWLQDVARYKSDLFNLLNIKDSVEVSGAWKQARVSAGVGTLEELQKKYLEFFRAASPQFG